MALSNLLGYPRIGPNRELKKATESYWAGKISQKELLEIGSKIRIENWKLQKSLGIDLIPSNDFSFYDHMLDTICLVGAIPKRYVTSGPSDLQTYFAMARGKQIQEHDVIAMEMTKWFDTNYHYIVPEFTKDQTFKLSSTKPFDEFNEAKSAGIITKPVLIGPISFLLLGKEKEEGFNKLQLLDKLLVVYKEILQKLNDLGASWIQIDEPCLVLDLSSEVKKLFSGTYKLLKESSPKSKILLTTYFDALQDNLKTALDLPLDAIHIDLVRAKNQLDEVLTALPKNMILSCGVIDGRNIWRNDLEKSYGLLERVKKAIGQERLMVSTSCSLLHTPYDLDLEKKLDSEIKSWLAFSKQKTGEVVLLSKAINQGKDTAQKEFEENKKVVQSPQVYDKRPMAKAFEYSRLDKASQAKLNDELQQEMLQFGAMAGSVPNLG